MGDSVKPFITGIAGGSGSGKTTLVQHLAKMIGTDQITLLHHDSYYRDRSMLTPKERSLLNYDHPDALETTRLVEHIELLRKGKSVEVPVYDFSTHCRKSTIETARPSPLIIVEGILVFAEPELVDLFDLKIFVDLDQELLLARRIKRDTAERGRTVESSLKQYRETTGPMFLKYVQPSRGQADLVISGDRSFQSPAVELLALGLKAIINRQRRVSR